MISSGYIWGLVDLPLPVPGKIFLEERYLFYSSQEDDDRIDISKIQVDSKIKQENVM